MISVSEAFTAGSVGDDQADFTSNGFRCHFKRVVVWLMFLGSRWRFVCNSESLDALGRFLLERCSSAIPVKWGLLRLTWLGAFNFVISVSLVVQDFNFALSGGSLPFNEEGGSGFDVA